MIIQKVYLYFSLLLPYLLFIYFQKKSIFAYIYITKSNPQQPMKALSLYFSKNDRFGSPSFYACQNSKEYVTLEKYLSQINNRNYKNSPVYYTPKYISITFNRNTMTNELKPKTLYTISFSMVENSPDANQKYINFKIKNIVEVPTRSNEVEVDFDD